MEDFPSSTDKRNVSQMVAAIHLKFEIVPRLTMGSRRAFNWSAGRMATTPCSTARCCWL
jgi:hypothetical protein